MNAYLIAFLAGIALLILAIFLIIKTISFLKTSEIVKGKVIELEEIYRSGDSKTVYKPVFIFKTKTNQEITHKSISASNPPAWKIGEEATYAYLSAKPTNGKVCTYFGLFGWSVALACLAFPLIIIGAGYVLAKPVIDSFLNNLA
mgnify:CR=1 FL=1